MVDMIGFFPFDVGEPKASRARHSELVGLLPFPEPDLRHFGRSILAGAAGY
jgi:hypothetical protein